VGAFPLDPEFAGEVQLLVNATRRVVVASGSLEATLGLRLDATVGERLADLIHPDDVDELRRCLAAVEGRPTAGAAVDTELRFRHADGSWRVCEARVRPKAHPSMADGVVVAFHDVTDRRQVEATLASRTARFQALAEQLSEVIVTVDDELRVRTLGGNVRSAYGHARDDLLGTPLIDLVHPADRFATLVDLEAILAGAERSSSVVARLRHADGTWVPTEVVVGDERSRELLGAISVTLRDVTGRVVAERERDRLHAIMSATPDLVTMVGRDGRLLYANPAATEFFAVGIERGGAPNIGRAEIPRWALERYRTDAAPALKATGTWRGELALTKEGREIPLSCVLVAHRDDDGHIDRVSAIARDISDAKLFEERLRHQATHDDLTGLPNRILLMDRLEMALARTARLETGVAVLFCDVDRFKVVNDSLGHTIGDELLKEVAVRLAASVRPGDTVARFGGDEFVLLCADLTSPRDAVVLSERVQAAVREPIEAGDTELVVTLSIGIAYDERGVSQPNALVRDADAAMYRAKSRGRDRAEVFDDALRRRALDRLDTESGLRRAIDDGRLVVHYQPVIDLRDDRVSGFEALMRWEHPERGLLAPGEFMEVAEETGLIVPLGKHLFAEACRQTVDWQQGQARDGLSVFVNFSAAQLRHATVVQDVAIVLEETGIDPGCVQVEVTEHALLDHEDVAVTQIAALKDLGLKIVIDDFGTGYSSLSYLQRFPVDLLKVDRSFVSGVTHGQGDAAIVRGVIDLAHRLGLSAVAEGVESPAQIETLRELGCERAQGFLLGRPATGPAQTAFLAGHPIPPERTIRPHDQATGAGAA
jgi:diguanylate cyclase (GGDEF)-like protein/PAS domain S-box-containing protein